MRFSLIGVLCLSVAQVSATTVVMVDNLICDTSRRPLISVTQFGKKVPKAKVDIYRQIEHGERLAWIGSTDQDGLASPKHLEPGSYRALVYSEDLSASVRLGVDPNAKDTIACVVDLIPPLSPEQQQKDRLAALMRNAPSVRLKEFRGVVEDPSGAVIPRLKIQVLHKGALDKNVAEGWSNEKGQFGFSLDPGSYIGVFSYQGFATRAIALEIGNDGWRGLQIEMSIGGSLRSPDSPPHEWDQQ